MTTAYGFAVLDQIQHNATQERAQDLERKLVRLDSGFGHVLVQDSSGIGGQSRNFRWFCKNRAAVGALKTFIEDRMGQLVPVWVPSFQHDLPLAQPTASTSTALVIRSIGYADRHFPTPARRYIAIAAPTGWLIRKVVSASDNGDGMETLGLDIAVGQIIPTSVMVCFLHLCRLESDDVEIEWHTTTAAECSMSFVEVPREAPE